nr:MAG TPA: Protein of unknown function (DUF1360) [Caudoviricetes sp.]
MGAYMSPSAPTSHAAGTSPAREALTDAALLAVDAVLTAGAALRVTRFATTDVLGGWVLADPAKRWAAENDPDGPHPFGYAAPARAWRHRLVSALDCPFCVGTQATLAIGAALALTSSPSRRRSPLGRALRAACATLGAAYVVGHVSHRIDSPASPQPTAPAPSTATKDSK